MLNDRETAFVAHVLNHEEPLYAAMRAGYSAKWAYHNAQALYESRRIQDAITLFRRVRTAAEEFLFDWNKSNYGHPEERP